MLGVLDDEGLGAEGENAFGGADVVGLAAEHAGFVVVDDEDVELAENFEEVVAVGGDPVVHGVAGDEFCVGQLGADAGLQDGVDVGEEEVVGVAIGGGNFRFEVGKDVEVGGEGFGGAEVFDVTAGPVKALAGDVLDAGGVDAAGGEDGFVLGEEVFA